MSLEAIALFAGALVMIGAIYALRRQENVTATAEWRDMRSQLESLQVTNRYFSGEVERLRREVEKREVTLDMLQDEVRVLKARCGELEGQNVALQAVIKDFRGR